MHLRCPRNHWRLTDAKNAQGQRIDALFVNADKPVQLDFADGRVGVSNTCNRMGGAYSVDGDELKFERMASTMMACTDAKLMALDQEIGKRLEGSARFAAGRRHALTPDHRQRRRAHLQRRTHRRNPLRRPRRNRVPGSAAQTKPCSHPLIPDKQCLQVRELKYDDKGIKTGTDGAFGNFYRTSRATRTSPASATCCG